LRATEFLPATENRSRRSLVLGKAPKIPLWGGLSRGVDADRHPDRRTDLHHGLERYRSPYIVARQTEHSRGSSAARCLPLRPWGAVDVSECTQLESDERHGPIERKAVRGMYQDLRARDRILRGSEDRVEIALRRRREACYCYPSGSTHRHVGVLVVVNS